MYQCFLERRMTAMTERSRLCGDGWTPFQIFSRACNQSQKNEVLIHKIRTFYSEVQTSCFIN